jgi:PTS system nitrogen regulatory IIA component
MEEGRFRAQSARRWKPPGAFGRMGNVRAAMITHFTFAPEAVGLADVATKQAAIEAMATLFSRVYDIDLALLTERLNEREAMGSTGFGRGVAIPHARVPGLKRPAAAFLKLARPIDFDSVDGAPVNLVFGLISPEQSGVSHLHALAAISRLMRDESVQASLLAASREDELFGVLSNVIDRDAA